MKRMTLFITCAKNLESLLAEELATLGARQIKQTVAGVTCLGDQTLAYRICLWSRLAQRVLLLLGHCNAEDAAALYDGVQQFDWSVHLHASGSLAVDFTGTSATIKHSHFGAQKVKDAICDQFRQRFKVRPQVDLDFPDLRVNVHLAAGVATVSIDLSGDSLHRRGYRRAPGAAPLKETLAAAILCRAGWPQLAAQNAPLVDPMCGSGTLLIEAALMAQDAAPGLLRDCFGLSRWLQHDEKLWQQLRREAEERWRAGIKRFTAPIYGFDIDKHALNFAKSHLRDANLVDKIQLKTAPISKITSSGLDLGDAPGLLVTNPPYGKRLHNAEGSLADLYRDLGVMLRHEFLHWRAAVFTGVPQLGKALAMRPSKQYNFFNGTISCKLLLFEVECVNFWRECQNEKEMDIC